MCTKDVNLGKHLIVYKSNWELASVRHVSKMTCNWPSNYSEWNSGAIFLNSEVCDTTILLF